MSFLPEHLRPQSANISETKLKQLIEEEQRFYFKTCFIHQKQVFGFRPGAITTIISTSSGGKSTYMRGINRDVILNNPDKRVHLLLTEESVESGQKAACKYLPDAFSRDSLTISSTLDWEDRHISNWYSMIVETIAFSKCDLFVLDNITTASFYEDRKPDEQASIALKLRKLAYTLKIPIVIVAHVGSTYQFGLIDQHHIRGSKAINSLSEYYYIIHKFTCNDVPKSILRVVKHRDYDIEQYFFNLKYEPIFRCFAYDEPMSFEEFKIIYNGRDKL